MKEVKERYKSDSLKNTVVLNGNLRLNKFSVVLAELNDGSQVIIEIQVAYQFYSIKRLWLYRYNQVTKNVDEHKKEDVETHRLAEEMLPVYSIAIYAKKIF